MAPAKQPFLVCYDYGMGGIWAYLWAEDRARIEQEIPSLAVVDALPDWLGDEPIRSIDIDGDDKWLSKMREAT